jgi:hypothetical protein
MVPDIMKFLIFSGSEGARTRVATVATVSTQALNMIYIKKKMASLSIVLPATDLA